MIFTTTTCKVWQMEIGKNIVKRLAQLEWNYSDLGRALHISPQAVQKWATGKNPKSTRWAAIAAALRTDVDSLLSGEFKDIPVLPLASNVEPGPDIKGNCPLISFVQAGEWCEIIDNFQPGDAEEWFPCPVPHSKGTFVLRINGESMLNPGGRPSFSPGDLIFCDPEISADNGSLVIIREEGEKQATFKKLLIEGNKRFIKALNPDWPEPIKEITQEATICGVVIFKGEMI